MKTLVHKALLRVPLLALGGLLAPAVLADRPEDFSRYQVILLRQPFGVPMAAPAQPKVDPMAPGQDAFIKNLRMCAITENDAGARVGLIDLQAKPPKSFFLYVGDIEDGIELVEADYVEERALLRKGAEEYWISMNASTAGATGSAAGAGGGVVSASVAAAGALNARRATYAERLRQRREAEQARLKALAARPALTPEQLDKQLKEFQMDIIRRGQPALPIPLTQEMDDQLVEEGVLPPVE